MDKAGCMHSRKITKYDLVDSVYNDVNCEKNEVRKIVESFLVQVRENLKDGSTIELRGFGTFELRLRKGRKKARNPKTGEQLSVEPHYVAAFRSGQDLKNALWDLPVEK